MDEIMSRCFDLDGTLLNYGNVSFTTFTNTALLDTLAGTPESPVFIKIATNQGGLQFGEDGVKGFPTVSYFTDRLSRLLADCLIRNIYIDRVFACIYHPKGDQRLEDYIRGEIAASPVGWSVTVLNNAMYRKPAPGMLQLAQCDSYYGDSDEDEQAAQACGVPFMRVDRFYGV